MTVRLEPLRWWHLEQVAALEEHLFGPEGWSPETFWSELAAPGRHYVAALNETDVVVGYAGLAVNRPAADVQTVAVAPAVQGQGLGRRLVADLVGAAAEGGATEVLLEVRDDNGVAQRLYRSFGFAQIARRRGYYQPGNHDALIMRLRPVAVPSP